MNRAGREQAQALWGKAQVFQVWQGQLLAHDGVLSVKSASDFVEAEIEQLTKIYLGESAGEHYFALHKEFAPDDGQNLRELFSQIPREQLEPVVTALALVNWHESHPKCSRCGIDTKVVSNGWVRQCPVDGSQHFPRTDPAIIVAVQDRNGRICLGRQESWPEGRYSNFAGFVEPGETLEAAVIREVEEESGLKVSDIKYLLSQPWPFPNSIMLAFEAFTDNPEAAKPDGIEIVDLKWFSKAELESAVKSGEIKLPPKSTVSGRMIAGWLNGQR